MGDTIINMNELNSFTSNSHEPYVTVKPRHTIFKIVLLVVIIATLAAVFFYNKQWWQLDEIVAPVPSVVVPLSEGETDAYRETLDKTLLPESKERNSNTITVPASAVKEITEREVAAITQPPRPVTPPSNASKVVVADLVPSDTPPATPQTVIQPNPYAPETVYLEGDIAITNFVIEQTTLQNEGTAVSVSGIVYVNEPSLKNAIVFVNQESFTVLFDTASISTKDGRTLNHATLKSGDIIAIKGIQFNDSKTIKADTVVLEGVADYVPSI